MPLKIFGGVVAVVLFIAYLLPLVTKLKEVSLGVVIAIAMVMMLVDLFQSLKSKED
jgi:hypothetical protein